MNPRGAPPAALGTLDDQLLDIQCSVDSQALNTHHMLDRFAEVFADGEVDEHDTDAVLDLFRHTRLEHHLNKETLSVCRWARESFSKLGGLISTYRARLQERERPLAGAASKQHAHEA